MRVHSWWTVKQMHYMEDVVCLQNDKDNRVILILRKNLYAPCGVEVGDKVFRYNIHKSWNILPNLYRGYTEHRKDSYINVTSEERKNEEGAVYKHLVGIIVFLAFLILCFGG